MSRSGNFRGDDNRQTDRQTDYFTPVHVCGVITPDHMKFLPDVV